jgi:hypothetical protein
MIMSSPNRIKYLIAGRVLLFLSIGIGVNSCEKVISVDLHQTNPQIVIRGIVTDQPGPDSVVISETGNYFEPSLTFPPVSGAAVVITDDTGIADTLKEAAAGTYKSGMIQGVSGRIYTLTVTTAGKEYQGISSMSEKVSIDSIYTTPLLERDGDRGYSIHVMFRDPPRPGNYYRLQIHTNLEPVDSLTGQRFLLYSDKITNGNEADFQIRAGRNNIKSGDLLTVELFSIDKAAYDYFSTLNDVLATDRSPTSLSPANPNTNLSNGSLGYFAAYTIDTKSIILP